MGLLPARANGVAPPQAFPKRNTVETRRGNRGLLAVLGMVAVTYTCGMTVADPDLWGHTLYGLRAIEQGLLVEPADPFSYTAPDARWINHEWLTEYQFGWLWQNTGGPGLWLWRNVMVVGVFSMGVLAISRSRANIGAATLLLFFTAECLCGYCVFIRPQLATFFLFAATLLILHDYWDRPSSRWIWLLPPLTALWTNLHGGFLAGLGIQAIFVAGWGIRVLVGKQDAAALTRLVAVGIMSMAATCVNPYGLQLHAMLWQHLISKQAVREWQPLWSIHQNVTFYLPVILVVLAAPGFRRMRWIDLAVIAVVALQAISHVRHVALLSITMLILLPAPLAESISRLFPRLSHAWNQPAAGRKRWTAILLACLLLLLLHAPATAKMWYQHGIKPWEIAVECRRDAPGMPVRAVAAAQAMGIHGNLITEYSWGQFVIWQMYPATKVAFDGRYRTVYPPKLEREFLEFQHVGAGAPPRTPMLDDYNTEIALLPNGNSVCKYLNSRLDWKLIYSDAQACLYVRDLEKFQQAIRQAKQYQTWPAIPPWVRFPAQTVFDRHLPG